MRTLTFMFVLLCGAMQAMAADPCASLNGKSIGIDGNGFHGTIGPNGIVLVSQNGTLTFETIAQFVNEPADPVKGQCKDRHITFTRTRKGAFVQEYDGRIFEKETLRMAGVFSHNAPEKKFGWYAEINFVN